MTFLFSKVGYRRYGASSEMFQTTKKARKTEEKHLKKIMEVRRKE
jgi:hypothetical protein